MRLKPLEIYGDDNSAKGSIDVRCAKTGKRMRWNDAARAGWVADLDGPAFNAYYSPEGIQQLKGGSAPSQESVQKFVNRLLEDEQGQLGLPGDLGTKGR
jgi:hypothetical protein